MSKIDLSKAKIGDKFRTVLGYIVIFTGLYPRAKKYKYMFAMFRNNLPQNSAKTDFLYGGR